MEEAEDADPTETQAHLAGEALEAFLVVLEEAALAVVLVAEDPRAAALRGDGSGLRTRAWP